MECGRTITIAVMIVVDSAAALHALEKFALVPIAVQIVIHALNL
jgi:hypothetical protein